MNFLFLIFPYISDNPCCHHKKVHVFLPLWVRNGIPVISSVKNAKGITHGTERVPYQGDEYFPLCPQIHEAIRSKWNKMHQMHLLGCGSSKPSSIWLYTVVSFNHLLECFILLSMKWVINAYKCVV